MFLGWTMAWQGFSLLGHRRGFDHSGSSLYSQVVRLVEELQPAMVLLENVSDIVHMGLQVIVDSLCGRLGYELRWMILGAGELGAPHLRRRWFCMACKPDATTQALQERVLQLRSDDTADYPWTRREMPPLMTLAREPSRRVRCAALGNAVVPDCVRHAFWTLLSMNQANLCPGNRSGSARGPCMVAVADGRTAPSRSASGRTCAPGPLRARTKG